MAPGPSVVPPPCGPPAPALTLQASATLQWSSLLTVPLLNASFCHLSNPLNQLGPDRIPPSLGNPRSLILIYLLKMEFKQRRVLMKLLGILFLQPWREGMRRG